MRQRATRPRHNRRHRERARPQTVARPTQHAARSQRIALPCAWLASRDRRRAAQQLPPSAHSLFIQPGRVPARCGGQMSHQQHAHPQPIWPPAYRNALKCGRRTASAAGRLRPGRAARAVRRWADRRKVRRRENKCDSPPKARRRAAFATRSALEPRPGCASTRRPADRHTRPERCRADARSSLPTNPESVRALRSRSGLGNTQLSAFRSAKARHPARAPAPA